jgi:hypothetical protein
MRLRKIDPSLKLETPISNRSGTDAPGLAPREWGGTVFFCIRGDNGVRMTGAYEESQTLFRSLERNPLRGGGAQRSAVARRDCPPSGGVGTVGAEPVVVVHEGLPYERVHLLTVAQVGAEVRVTSVVETSAAYPADAFLYPGTLFTSRDLEVPSLAVRPVERIDFSDPEVRVLYSQGEVLAAYDPARANEWIHHELFGWMWVRDYPWFYSTAEESWLYTTGGELQEAYIAVYPPPLPVVLYWVYHFEDGAWKRLSHSLSPVAR